MKLSQPELQSLVERRLEAFREKAGFDLLSLDLPGDTHRVLACSDFVADACIRDPALVSDLMETGHLLGSYGLDHYRRRCQDLLSEVSSEDVLFVALRRIRHREMVRIAWRDLLGIADLDETVADLSAFADAIIDATLDKLYGWLCARFGTPQSPAGEKQRLVVLGMGKLGGQELNFSSDVDLIFTFPSAGHTVADQVEGHRGRKVREGLSNHEFFIRLGRRMIQLLGQTTEEGWVFRVDMRLRPFGGSGPLVESFDALEDYYQTHGRDWERYAWIRARPVAGDIAAGEALLDRLRPFIYRRYLDFGAIDALREMKELINREGQRKGYQENIKLGPGGIREVEFLVQALQMIYGGRQADLRERRTLLSLARLGDHGHFPPETVQELSQAYRFLRMVEHRLQEVDDRQTHQVPDGALERERLAAGLGFAGWGDFSRIFDEHRANVQRHFERVFAPSSVPEAVIALPLDGGTDEGKGASCHLFATASMDKAQAIGALGEMGFPDADETWETFDTLRKNTPLRFLSERGQRRLEKLLPLVLPAVAHQDASLITLHRVFQVLEAIGRRSVYFSLLLENPVALEQLVRLCAASPWVTRRIADSPLLLDELLDPRALYAPLGISELEADLKRRLEQVTPGDTEQEMDTLRRFKQANVLRIAAADVCRVMPLMVVSDHLTAVAEVCLRAVLRLVWRDLTRRHGRPRRAGGGSHLEHGEKTDTDMEDIGFLIIAYGKLGGWELGYGSDLDLVFLHDGSGEGPAHTDGDKPIDNSVFFARLGQRIIHFLSTHTPAGILYETDARLRPSGRSGPLVSNLDAFASYQHQEAWTWEHQALVRARAVAGDPRLVERFNDIRLEVLRKQREAETLRREVREMRERMRQELDTGTSGTFDLKQGSGGIADIEFMVQYATLRWADRLGGYLSFSDNIRLLAGMEKANLMAGEDTEALAEIYRRYRAEAHRLALQEHSPLVGEGDEADGEGATFTQERALVSRLWKKWMEEGI